MEMIREASHIARASAAASFAAGAAREYLTFRLGGEEYGIGILQVREIRSYEPPTRLANTPAFLRGVLNLRGDIVPIIDLRLKLGCERADIDAMTVVVVLGVLGRVIGAVVDSVSDVLELPPDAVRPTPPMNSLIDTSFISGIGSLGERTLILLDIEALMGSADMGLMEVSG